MFNLIESRSQNGIKQNETNGIEIPGKGTTVNNRNCFDLIIVKTYFVLQS